jgi:hypothetical protein
MGFAARATDMGFGRIKITDKYLNHRAIHPSVQMVVFLAISFGFHPTTL